MDIASLIEYAVKARQNAYAPYSHYKVGAALIADDGKIYTGCNVENASYGATNCAERTAVFKAISEGAHQIMAIAIVGGQEGKDIEGYAFPCGICRQVLREFSNPDELKIYVGTSSDNYKEYTLSQLLPDSFGPDALL